MSTLMSRGAVLTASRLSNFAILVVSPLLLVRLLDVEEYGRYQEFMLYAMLVITAIDLGIGSSMTYFVPKNPDRERAIISQTSVLILLWSCACVLLLLLFRPILLEHTSYDFVAPLAVYVLCFANLNWLEYLWIAKRRPELVLIYSAGRLLLRIGTLLIVAYMTRDVEKMIWAIVGAEALRVAAVAGYLIQGRMFTSDWRLIDLKEQIQFAGPIGLAGLVQSASRSIGKLFISISIGPAALAQYTVASYLLPLVRLIRGSIADVVFPEIVRVRHDPESALRLWRRTNVLYCVLLFPTFTLLAFYGKLFIVTLFTEAYLPAVPVFQIYMVFLLRRCFNLDVLLRSGGRTGFVFVGSLLALATNVALLFVLHRHFSFVGPAIAFVVSEIILELYYATRVTRELQQSGVSLVDWRGVASVAIGCIAGLPVLLSSRFFPGPELLQAVVASIGFVSIAWFVAYRRGVADVGKLVSFALSPVRRLVRV